MADKDVYLNFGADTAGLEAGLAQANAAVRAYTREMNNLANQLQRTGAGLDSELGQKLTAASGKLAQAKSAAAGLREELGKLSSPGESAEKSLGGLNPAQMAESMHVVKALFDEIAAGQSPMRALAVEGGRIGQILMQGIPPAILSYAGLAGAVLVAAGAVGYFAVQAYQGSQAVQSIRLDAAVNGFQLSAEAAALARDSIKSLADVSDADAAKILKPFAALGQTGATVAGLLAPSLKDLAQQMGGDVVKAAETLAERFVHADTTGLQFVNASRQMTQAEKDNYAQLIASGKQAQAYAVLIDLSTRSLMAKKKADGDAADAEDVHKMAMVVAANAGLTLEEAERKIAQSMQEAGSAADSETAKLKALAAQLATTSAAAQNYGVAMSTALRADSVAGSLRETNAQIATLENALKDAPDRASPAYAEIGRSLEILRDRAKGLQNQMADPLVGANRGDLAQYEADQQLKAARSRATSEQILRDEIAANRAKLGDARLTEAERQQLTLETAQKERQLFDSQTKAGDKSAKDVLGSQVAGYDGQIRALEDQTRAVTEHLAAQVKLKQITAKQGEDATIAALKTEQAAVDALYAKELALSGLTLTKKQEIANKEMALNDQVALRIQEAQDKAAEASQKSWDSATKQIGSAFDSQISGLERGTTSWAQASRNVVASLATDLVKFYVNWGVQDLASLAKHAAVNAGLLASDSSTQTAATAIHASGAAAKKAVDATTVAGDAARSAAGAYAAVAGVPLIGPVLAPAAAAAAYAGTMAFAAFDIGAWNLPQDQLAMVHKNELVMPAAEAGAFRDMLTNAAQGGGAGGANVSISPTTHFTVNAIDGASASQWMRDNQHSLMRAIDEGVRHGAHLGLRRLATT